MHSQTDTCTQTDRGIYYTLRKTLFLRNVIILQYWSQWQNYKISQGLGDPLAIYKKGTTFTFKNVDPNVDQSPTGSGAVPIWF